MVGFVATAMLATKQIQNVESVANLAMQDETEPMTRRGNHDGCLGLFFGALIY